MLEFKKITINDMQLIKGFFAKQTFRTCDFSLGGLFMWTDYFDYSYCVYEDTLFIRGKDMIDPSSYSYALPIGAMEINRAVECVCEYARKRGELALFSAIPESELDTMTALNPCRVIELTDWSDYLYSAEALATLKGHKYNKKRNRLNLFLRSYDNYSFTPITTSDKEEVLKFMINHSEESEHSNLADYENYQSVAAAKIFELYGFIGGKLCVDGQIVGITFAEVIGDTMYVHIEKADIAYNGVYQALNYFFSAYVMDNYDIKYINREEDVGDEGLRKSKLSYFPIQIIKKYRVDFDCPDKLKERYGS